LALQKMQSPKVMEYWNNSTRWRVEKEQLIPLAVGILAYIGLETLFIILNLPHQMFVLIYIAIFPAIAIPMVMGAKYGPIIGFLTGFTGKLLVDLIVYGGIWILWPLGIGLMGFIPGLILHKYYKGKYAEGINLFKFSLVTILAAFIGAFIPAMLSVFIDQLGIVFPLIFYFLPLFCVATFNGFIFSPIFARSVEHFEYRYFSNEATKSPSSKPTNINEIASFLARICFFISFGLFLLNNYSSAGGNLGCHAGVPFGHEVLGNLRISLDVGMYFFLGLGIFISVILIIRFLRYQR